MFDELFGSLDQTINDFCRSEAFQIGLRVLVVYFVLVWLASAFWAYRDMRQRSTSALAPYVAAAASSSSSRRSSSSSGCCSTASSGPRRRSPRPTSGC